jgi:hypothetical protein
MLDALDRGGSPWVNPLAHYAIYVLRPQILRQDSERPSKGDFRYGSGQNQKSFWYGTRVQP